MINMKNYELLSPLEQVLQSLEEFHQELRELNEFWDDNGGNIHVEEILKDFEERFYFLIPENHLQRK